MIELRDVQFRYPGGDCILKGINLTVGLGEYILVCGLNGSGKSTLGYILNGLIPNFIEGEFRGRALIDGRDTQDLNVSELALKVGMVLQNPDAQLFHSTVADDIAFGLANAGLKPSAIENKVKHIAEALHLQHLLDRSPGDLSGGEKRLAAIAAVLALDPSIVVLDEPLADLDYEGVRLVSQVLKKVHRDGKTVIVMEQRLEGLLLEASRCLVLETGRVVFDDVPEKAASMLLEKRLIPQYPHRLLRDTGQNRIILTATKVYSRFNGHQILQDISLTIREGESVALIGKNGSGKTTLIKHFNALMIPWQGAITFEKDNVRQKRTHELAASMGMAFQNPNDQFFKIRVLDELTVGPRVIGRVDNQWTKAVCNLFELSGLLERSPYHLSEGEKKRVAFASVFTMKPRLVILDEPTVGQDGRFRETLASFLKELEKFGFTLLIVTHDFDFARAVTDRWIILHEGKIIGDGSPDSFAEKNLVFIERDDPMAEPESLAFENKFGRVAHAQS